MRILTRSWRSAAPWSGTVWNSRLRVSTPCRGGELVHVRVGDLGHPAVGVRHHQHAFDAQQVDGQDEGTQHVVGHARARVAQDLGVARPQPEQAKRVDAGVHAGHHRQPACGPPVRPECSNAAAYSALAARRSSNAVTHLSTAQPPAPCQKPAPPGARKPVAARVSACPGASHRRARAAVRRREGVPAGARPGREIHEAWLRRRPGTGPLSRTVRRFAWLDAAAGTRCRSR